jgi:alpha-tubulin suppressor-like RCC1 family protein
MTKLEILRFGLFSLLSFVVLSGCGGNNSQKNTTFSVGGTLSGLADGATIVLQNNGVDDLVLTTNGSFMFARQVSDGAAYEINIRIQPEDQNCVVTQGMGNIAGADVTDILVTCTGVGETYSIGGMLSGLLSGTSVVLQNNGVDDLVLTTNGFFVFETKLADETDYQVSIRTQPEGQICSLSHSTGKILKGDVTDISVACAATDNSYTLGGIVAGLEGKGLVLQNNGGDDLEISDNGEFTFNTSLADGADYNVSVVAQPVAPDQVCSVTNGTGTVTGAKVTNIAVSCVSLTTASIDSFSVSSELVSSGDEITLSWTTRGATSCTINHGVVQAEPAGMGAVSASVSNTTEFTLTCEGTGQPVSSNPVTVYVTDTDWVKVTAKVLNTCALKRDGRLFCWGGTQEKLARLVSVPTQEETEANDWIDVSVGGEFICAIKSDGRLFCWKNWDSTPTPWSWNWDPTPSQELTEATDWNSVSSGGSHTCAVKSDGSLFCWGANISGQLGNDSTADSSVAQQESTAATDWAEVSSGNASTCAIKSDGRLFCWGYNIDGQLGNGSDQDSHVPVQESTAAADWAQVSVGSIHTCAVKTDGRLFCWGANSNGQLGTNSNEDSLIPVQEYTSATDWAEVSTGDRHTCGLKNDGRIFCWGGAYRSGELGSEVTFTSFELLQEKTLSTDWTQLSLGSSHTCALKDDGRVFCWGEPDKCGNNVTSKTILSLQDEWGEADWAQVSVGYSLGFEYACAVKNDGRLFCWGTGHTGQLGAGSIVISSLPVQEYTAASDWFQVSAGAEHACAVKSDGRLFCWGSNSYGQLGNGSNQDSPVPVQEYTSASDWKQVSAGSSHTCALKDNGRIFCWGSGDSGELGNASNSDSSVPVPESTNATNWVQVSAGPNETRAVKTDGRLFGWGYSVINVSSNDNVPVEDRTAATDWIQIFTECGLKKDGRIFCLGPLGNDSSGFFYKWVQEETTASDWVDVSNVSNRTCAIKADGRLYCWGDGVEERFEVNSSSNSTSIVQENTAANDWTKVANGGEATCALKIDNRLFCWGYKGSYPGSSNFGPVWPPQISE